MSVIANIGNAIEIVCLIGVAILPAIIQLILVWGIDKIEKEPIPLVLGLFFLGVFSCIPVAILELIYEMFLNIPPYTNFYFFIQMFFIVGICEECGKFLVLFFPTWWNKHFKHKYDAIVYATSVSLGFATLENIFYVLSNETMDNSGLYVAIMRALMSIPAHFSFGTFMGFFYGIAKKYANRNNIIICFIYIFATLFIPIFLHGCFDYFLSIVNGIFIIPLLIGIILLDMITIGIVIYCLKTDSSII